MTNAKYSISPSGEKYGWEDDIFKITPLAIDINDTRALHAAQLVRDALRNMGCEVNGMGRGHIQRIKESVRKKK